MTLCEGLLMKTEGCVKLLGWTVGVNVRKNTLQLHYSSK
jgi:hypothetical protein